MSPAPIATSSPKTFALRCQTPNATKFLMRLASKFQSSAAARLPRKSAPTCPRPDAGRCPPRNVQKSQLRSASKCQSKSALRLLFRSAGTSPKNTARKRRNVSKEGLRGLNQEDLAQGRGGQEGTAKQ